VEHRDSAGHGGRIGPGDVQWMTAARGIVHEEKHGREFTKRGGMLEMVQLWVNLPARDKMSPPRYQDLLADDIPNLELGRGAGTVRVIAGEFGGARGPAKTFTPVELWDVRLRGGTECSLALPEGHSAMLLVQDGLVHAGGSPVRAFELALLSGDGGDVGLTAPAGDARLLLLAGEPIRENVIGYGPFVMNTRAEIGQAIEDFENGVMGRLDS
jgi:redox-sensitive bicupin YhaK (pirin superfamily)